MSSASPAAPASQEVTWTAGAVARMLGVPASTLRGWHRRYDIPPAGRRGGRHRRYTEADVKALVRMRQLIARGVDAHSASRLAFNPVTMDVDTQDLVAAALRLDDATLVSLLDAHMTTHGVVDTWDELCRPALNALGGPETSDLLAYVDVVHLLSWAVTAALHRVVTAAPVSHAARTSRPPVLLACTVAERHVLPMEALRAALAQRGVPAHLLGATTPDSALREALRRTDPQPTALVLWAQSAKFARTDLLGDPATRATNLVLAGPGWPAAGHGGDPAHPASLAAAVELLAR